MKAALRITAWKWNAIMDQCIPLMNCANVRYLMCMTFGTDILRLKYEALMLITFERFHLAVINSPWLMQSFLVASVIESFAFYTFNLTHLLLPSMQITHSTKFIFQTCYMHNKKQKYTHTRKTQWKQWMRHHCRSSCIKSLGIYTLHARFVHERHLCVANPLYHKCMARLLRALSHSVYRGPFKISVTFMSLIFTRKFNFLSKIV